MVFEVVECDFFYSKYMTYFPEEAWKNMRSYINSMNTDQFNLLINYPFKNPSSMVWAAFPCGVFGVDRFLLGDTGLGIVKMLTFGQFLIGFTVDCFTIKRRTRDYNYEQFLNFKINLSVY